MEVVDSFNNTKNVFGDSIEFLYLDKYDFIDIVEELYKSRQVSLRQLIIIANELIYLDTMKAKKLIKFIKKHRNSIRFEIELRYLKGKLNEKELYFSMDENESDRFEYLLQKAKKYTLSKKYTEAYYCYEAAYYISQNPIIYYYIGKIYFKLNMFEEAKDMFNNYLQCGGEKILKCLLYLSIISNCELDKESLDNYIKMSKKIEALEDINFDIAKRLNEYTKIKKESIRISKYIKR